MIEGNALLKNSPFQAVHNDTEYNLSNTTSDLLKFQLQEEHKSKLKELENLDANNTSNIIDGNSFNNHLQNKLDEGEISIEEIPSLISTPTSFNDDVDSNEIFDASYQNKPNYLNLKILIENSAFENSKLGKNSILSIKSLKIIKNLIEEKTDLKIYYDSKLSISQEFISNLINDDEVDSTILFKIIKSTNSLNRKINDLNNEINDLTLKLNNHNLSCLLLGYIEDIKLNGGNSNNHGSNNELNSSPETIRKIFDKFIGYIASISVQRNVSLPAPPSIENSINNDGSTTNNGTNDENSLENKYQWLKQCIDQLLTTAPSSQDLDDDNTNMTTIPTSTNTPSRNLVDGPDNSILNESSIMSISPVKPSSSVPAGTNSNNINNVNNEHLKIINDYKTALNDLRFSHQYLIKEFEYSRENSIKIIQDHRKKNLLLEKELNNLKNSHSNNNNSSNGDNYNPQNDSKDQEISKLRKQLNNYKIDTLGNELDNNNNNSDNNGLKSPSMGGSSMSNGILRKEFKKIVSDIQDQYEIELSHERILRKKLQDEIEQLKN